MDFVPTILAVDDQKENLDILLNILDEFDVIPAISGAKALEIAQEENISLILLDIVMPDMDGIEVCKKLKADPLTQAIPVIFTTAKTDEESIAKAYGAGANDYVSKPLKRVEVIERVKTQLRLQKTLQELEFLASRDSMTGIYNRRKFFELAQPLFKNAQNLFVAMIDIDHFKKINDNYGHDAGDIVIKTLCNTISELLPKNAIFARFGGEEFTVICTQDSINSIQTLFENIKSTMASLCIQYNSEEIHFTISSGIAQKSSFTKTLDALLKEADLALYSAKDTGRNKVVVRQSV
jgi:diguanylate cyclase (GGDEF)-like protein